MANVAYALTADIVKQIVQSDTERVIKIVNSSSTDKDQELEQIFEEIVDSGWMGRFSIGSIWKTLTPEQQNNYIGIYKKYLLHSYMPKFKQYHAEKYSIDGIEDLGDDQFIVSMTVQQPNLSPSIKLDYRLKCIDKSCYIRDIIAENISMMTSQRADFSAIISNKGFEGLVHLLSEKYAIKK